MLSVYSCEICSVKAVVSLINLLRLFVLRRLFFFYVNVVVLLFVRFQNSTEKKTIVFTFINAFLRSKVATIILTPISLDKNITKKPTQKYTSYGTLLLFI